MSFFLSRHLLIPLCYFALAAIPPTNAQTTNDAPSVTKLKGTGEVIRSVLKREELMQGTDLLGPMDETAGFAIPANAAEPSEFFEGTLTLKNVASNGHFTLLSDVFQLVPPTDSYWKHLPPFTFHFVQSGSSLIPVEQGLAITGDLVWNYIVGPGRVWRESNDGEYMRASLPFALVQRNQNCVHNGELTFLFNARKNPNISRVYYQITQETCYPMKFNLWGTVEATFLPGVVPAGREIRTRFAAEQSQRMPTKPLSALSSDFPNAGVDVAQFPRAYKHPEEITTYGLIFRGVHYSSGCATRFGEYAFCSEMRLPSYSIAKSVFAGVALMRLGQLYGPSVYNLRIKDYIPADAIEGRWGETTFGNTSDMATGNFNSTAYEADEDSSVTDKFIVDESLEAKTRDAFAFHQNFATPGTTWVYQSAATFLVTQAMQTILHQKQGTDADLFDLARKDIYEPLRMSQGFMTTIRTDNSPHGAPTGYYGLFFNKDDVGKIADFLNTSSGKIDGKQVLESVRLAEALFRGPTPETVGVPIVGRDAHSVLGEPVVDAKSQPATNGRRYAHGFWGRQVARGEFPQFPCDFWISIMSGYGGNVVLLLPNGASFYAFSDGMEFPWRQPTMELVKFSPICK
jgi:hypothetical protein